MEEFGYPRDDFKFALGTPTKGRDGFYQYVFSLVADNAEQGGYFAGCNFWGWGGYARPEHEQQWLVGDDYTGDPAQEQQGLNSVFSGDKSTMPVQSSLIILAYGRNERNLFLVSLSLITTKCRNWSKLYNDICKIMCIFAARI